MLTRRKDMTTAAVERSLDSLVAGDDFSGVFVEHRTAVFRLAYLLCGDRQGAEDAASEAFERVYIQWCSGRVADVGPYLRTAVVNQVRGGFRRRLLESRARARGSDGQRGTQGFDDHVADHDRVWRAIAVLPYGQRAALVLRYYEDLSEADAAAVLGCSIGTVKSQVARALRRLRGLLGEDEE